MHHYERRPLAFACVHCRCRSLHEARRPQPDGAVACLMCGARYDADTIALWRDSSQEAFARSRRPAAERTRDLMGTIDHFDRRGRHVSNGNDDVARLQRR